MFRRLNVSSQVPRSRASANHHRRKEEFIDEKVYSRSCNSRTSRAYPTPASWVGQLLFQQLRVPESRWLATPTTAWTPDRWFVRPRGRWLATPIAPWASDRQSSGLIAVHVERGRREFAGP